MLINEYAPFRDGDGVVEALGSIEELLLVEAHTELFHFDEKWR